MQKFLSYAIVIAFAGLVPLAGCSDKGAATKTKVVIKPKTDNKGEKTSGTEVATTDTATAPSKGGSEAPAAGVGSFKGRVVLQGTAPQLALLVRKGASIQ